MYIYIYICIHIIISYYIISIYLSIYIYIYIEREMNISEADGLSSQIYLSSGGVFLFIDTGSTANLPTKILGFRGFDSNRSLILRGGMLRSGRSFPEIRSQRILAGRES